MIGKLASCAAMAMTFASYAAPSLARPLAVGAVLALTAVNYRGVQKTAAADEGDRRGGAGVARAGRRSRRLGGTADIGRLSPLSGTALHGVMQSAGLLFFAFAGYARMATLGEEVIEPARTIPRAIPIALGVALIVYAAVGISVLAGAGAARSPRPARRSRPRSARAAASLVPGRRASGAPSRRWAPCCRCSSA